MKKFRVRTPSSTFDIEADAVRFEPGHVVFWRDVRSGGLLADKLLVRALHNPAVEAIWEVADESK